MYDLYTLTSGSPLYAYFSYDDTKSYTYKVHDVVEQRIVFDEDNSMILSFVMPGFGKDDITATLEDSKLQVTAKNEKSETLEVSHRVNVDKYDVDKMSAKMENGILEVTFPVREAKKQKKIKIL